MRRTHCIEPFIGVAISCVGIFLVLSLMSPSAHGSGEFDLSKHSVPLKEILSGGPPKDGIPAILNPVFVQAKNASFLHGEDRVLGLSSGTESKAYPVKILNWHEIVNDTLGDKPVLITYCPLCGTGIAFTRDVGDRQLSFGVSGLLYQSDMVMYDHQTESLWSQISMEAIAGPMTGSKLQHIFLEHTTWSEWRRSHPNTLVLSTKTGHIRSYNRDPYLGYAQSADLMFGVNHIDPSYHPKEWVLGVEVNGTFKAYPFAELKQVKSPLQDQVNGKRILVLYNPGAVSASVTDTSGKSLPSVMAFWFAWYAFHPDTEVFKITR